MSLYRICEASPSLGTPDRLFDFLEKITLSKYGFRCLSGERDYIKTLLKKLERYPINVKLIPDLFDLAHSISRANKLVSACH